MMDKRRKEMRRFSSKIIIIISLVMLLPTLLFSVSMTDLRYIAMGESGIALYDTPNAFKINPAALFFQEPALFSVNMNGSESFFDKSLAGSDPLWEMQNPSTLLEFVFSTRYSALCVGFGFDLEDREVNDSNDGLLFNSYNNSHIQFNVSYGFKALSFGIFLRGGSRLQRLGVSIDSSNSIVDYISQVYLNRYYPSNDEQQFSSGIGLLVTYPYISLAILTNSFFIMEYDSNEVTIDAVTLIEDATMGLALSSNTYNSDNDLNRVVFTSAFDISKIADELLRSIHMGLEVKIQFLKDLYIAFQAGYKETRAIPLPLIGLDGTGSASFGISSQMTNLFINGALVLPYSWFSSTPSSEAAKVQLALHYNF
jgi:hypothetical protein